MSSVKDLKSKVINTLSILSGQDITETKLYKTILTASDKDKSWLIILSSLFPITFSRYGKSLETTKIYEWLEILFDRFKVEEGIDIKDYMYKNMAAFDLGNCSYEELLRATKANEEPREDKFLPHNYAESLASYFSEDGSNIERIVKIIQPLELFILTAITVMPIACHIDQKPFEYYVNMDLYSILNILADEYYSFYVSMYNEFSKISYEHICKNMYAQYTLLDLLIARELDRDLEEPDKHAIVGQFRDEIFGKIINVSEKSEYEKLKGGYKK